MFTTADGAWLFDRFLTGWTSCRNHVAKTAMLRRHAICFKRPGTAALLKDKSGPIVPGLFRLLAFKSQRERNLRMGSKRKDYPPKCREAVAETRIFCQYLPVAAFQTTGEAEADKRGLLFDFLFVGCYCNGLRGCQTAASRPGNKAQVSPAAPKLSGTLRNCPEPPKAFSGRDPIAFSCC